MEGPIDPNAPTRTVAPGAAVDDADRTRSSGDHTHATAVGTPPLSGAALRPRAPAPLQYRDPDRYEVLAEHGRGGLGRVMRARDRELGRSVAIKEMLHPGLTSELRFFREALITARLEHPGIVPVHEAGRWPDGTPFYAMKLVAGRPLKELIDAASSMEARLALLPHVIAVSDAVAYAHAMGIIHRDLKPSNVIVGDYGETVVIDWGLAKDIRDLDDAAALAVDASAASAAPVTAPMRATDPDSGVPTVTAPGIASPPVPAPSAGARVATPASGRDQLTVAGTVLGTPGYMPPEQAAGIADARSDIYSIGALLSHLLFGHAPGGPPGEPVAPPAAITAKVPPALRAIVDKAMASDPAHRYATARALGDDLRQYQSGQLVSAHHYSLAQLVRHWASHNKGLLTVSLLAVSSLALVLTLSASRIVRERDRAEGGQEALILSNARNAATRDPTKALLWARLYQGPNRIDAQDIAAESVARGVATHVLNEHADMILAIREAAGTAMFASASRDGTLREWRVTPEGIKSTIVASDVNEFGIFAYHAARQRSIRITWNRTAVLRERSGSERTLSAPFSPETAIFSPDGSKVLLVAKDGAMAVVDLDGSSATFQMSAADGLLAMSWLDGSGTIAAVHKNGAVRSWSAVTGAVLPTVEVGPADLADIVPSGQVIGLRTGGEVFVYSGGATRVGATVGSSCRRALWVSPQRRMAALWCDDAIVVVGLPDGRLLHKQPVAGRISGVAFAADDSRMAFTEMAGTVVVIDTVSWTARRLIGHDAPIVTAPVFVATMLLSGDASGEIRAWSTSGQAVGRVAMADGSLRRVAASPGEPLLATDSSTGVVRIWTSAGELKQELRVHDGVIPTVQFSNDGNHVVTPGWDGTIHLAPAAAGGREYRYRGTGDKLTSVMPFGPDYFFTTAAGEARLWNPRTDESRLVYKASAVLRRVDATASHIVFGSEDGSVYEYDAASAAVTRLWQHAKTTEGVVYSQDGTWVVSSDTSGTIRFTARTPDRTSATISTAEPTVASGVVASHDLVAVASSRSIRLFELVARTPRLIAQHDATAKRMAFSPDGRLLAAACEDGIVRLWNLNGDAAAFAFSSEVPQGITFADGGAVVAATTAYELLTARVDKLPWIPRSDRGMRDSIERTIVTYQGPHRVSDEEGMLSNAQGN